MVVGTYTDAGSQGLYSFSFDQSTGKASGITSLKVDNPSYFTSVRMVATKVRCKDITIRRKDSTMCMRRVLT